MNSQKSPFKACFTVASKAAFMLVVALTLFATGTQKIQAGEIAEAPLFVSTSGVNPNIMMILDDSGSMMFEVMPDEYAYSGTYYVFPRVSGVYGSSDYSNYPATLPSDTGTANQNAYGALMRSSAWNKVYYNPAITYTPWKKHDGSDYPNASPSCALHNPERSGTTTTYCRDLTVIPGGCSESCGVASCSGSGDNKKCTQTCTRTCPSSGFGMCSIDAASCTKTCSSSGKSATVNNMTCGAYSSTPTTTTSSTPSGTSWRTCSSSGSCNTSTTHPNPSFIPATYFTYDTNKGDAGKWTYSNYTKKEIRSSISTYSGEGRDKRTDCDGGVCTYAQEMQNFANWYTYYRSRVLAARAGIGKAFAKQGEDLRVGFGTINKSSSLIDEVSTSTVVSGVRDFKDANRQGFFTNLYTRSIPAQGTPLREALQDAGNYFSRTDARGPWGNIPGSNGGISYGCRRSYTILMTDGYWNSVSGRSLTSVGNVDNKAGNTITGTKNPPYKYAPVAPFKDGNSDTLADVAMYYWNKDLVSDDILINNVPTSTMNPAFWQHMVTFGVGLGVEGSIKKEDAFNAITSGADINWPKPSTSGGYQNIDDLLHAGVNSRGGFFSAADPDTFANELSGLLEEIVAREATSASAVALSSTKLDTGTMSYQAKFDTNNWSGQLNAYPIAANGTISKTPDWSSDDAGKIPAHNSRNIYTIVGTAGKEFLWSNLNTTQKTALKTLGGTVGSDDVAQERLNWIRGDQSKEKTTSGSGIYRSRTTPLPGGAQLTRLLGDIVNSNPLYVGAPLTNSAYLSTTGYVDFVVGNSNRTPMIYIGANDGMLHAFDAATGVEKFAYIPNSLFPKLSLLPQPNYSHTYFVDGTPIVADAQIGGAWKSILIGTTGAGGRSVFALDVTNPNSFAASKVLWEFSDNDLGYTIGKPTIGQLKDGTWVAVFSNGYNSNNGKAFLFVVNLATGAQIAKIATNVGDTTNHNGLAGAAVLPDPADGRMVAAYAGDLRGNLWKFDLISKTVAFSGSPLFVAKNSSSTAQPITAAPAIAKHPDGGYLVLFGTGKYFEVGDHNATANTQSVYGIWDKATLNNGSWSGGSVISGGRSALQVQTVIGESVEAGNKWRAVSKNPLNWAIKRGWYVDLPTAGERVVYSAQLINGRMTFNTIIPAVNQDLCEFSSGTSWFMAVDIVTGGRTASNTFDVDRDGKSSASDYITINGEKVVASGFETTVGGMSQATLMKSGRGIDVLTSGTGALSTTASSTSEADTQTAKNLQALVDKAESGAVTSAEQAQAKADATAAAAAAAAALAANSSDPVLQQADRDARAKKAAAEAAATAANTAERQAIIDAAQAIIDAAQAIITAGGTANVSVAEAAAIKAEAESIKAAALAVQPGLSVPTSLAPRLPPLAAQLMGQSKVGGTMLIESSRQSWQQLQ